MKRTDKTTETTKNGREPGASRASSATAKNARANGGKPASCGAFKSSSRSRPANRKQTPAELRKEIGRLSVEFINCEE